MNVYSESKTSVKLPLSNYKWYFQKKLGSSKYLSLFENIGCDLPYTVGLTMKGRDQLSCVTPIKARYGIRELDEIIKK